MRLYCRVRRTYVADTPEERVRLALLEQMIGSLGYSESGFVVEKSLHHMPHLQTSSRSFPKRRADIVFFAGNIQKNFSLYPLIMIECKREKFGQEAIRQVLGYNHFLGACFVAVAAPEEVFTGRYDTALQQYQFTVGLPSFSSLMETLSLS